MCANDVIRFTLAGHFIMYTLLVQRWTPPLLFSELPSFFLMSIHWGAGNIAQKFLWTWYGQQQHRQTLVFQQYKENILHHTSVIHWHKAGWMNAFMLFTPNSDATIQILQEKSRQSDKESYCTKFINYITLTIMSIHKSYNGSSVH